EADYYDGGFPDMEPQNSTVMDIDPAIGHEIGHTTIWLPDLYGHPHFISNVFLKDEQGNPYAGTKLYPAVNNGGTAMLNSGTYHYTDHLGLGYSPLMDYCHLWLHPANAGFSNHMAQSRSGLVDHFGYHVPSQNAIQVFDVNDQPLTGAAVYMYQMINTGLPHTVGGKYMPDRPKFIGNTDANGKYEIPNLTHATWDDWETDNVEGAIHITNPFGRSATDRAWGPSWTVGEYLLIKIVSEGNVEFRFLTLTDLNEAFYSGKTGQATHKIRTNLPPSSSFTPAVPPVIPDEIKVTNLAPVIVVPQDIKVNQGGELVIDASNSFDPEGQPLIFRWFGPTEATGPVLRTTAPTSLGDYVYWLLVIDGYRWSHVEVKVKVVANTLVYGKVTDASGKPVPYAVVGIKQGHYATADAKHYAVADADGNYKLQFVDPGTYYLAPWKDGFAPGSDRAVTVVANQSVKQDLLLTTLAGKNLIQGTQLVSASTSEGGYTPSKAVDGDRITAWQTPYWPEDPSFFYVSLGTPRDISGITIYRFYEENSWGNYSDNYSIDVMTAGDPLNPASWENNPNVQTVYSAERSTHGYPISQNLAADPIGIKLNGVLGIRLRFEDNRWPDMYDIRELVVHSTTDFSGLAYGTVKDTSGNLVPEAVVQVGGPTSNILLITDATGSWSFPLDPGSYQLYADAPGHVGRLISFQVPGDGTPYSKDIILPAKSEPGLYNGDFEIASIQDDRKPDGWELFIQTGGNSDMYRYGRATYDNTTPGGSACGYLQVGTRNQSLPYLKEGWMKPLNTHWIPVNPNSTYNFYFKAKKTGYAASFWRLVWRRANGSEIRSVISPGWYWIPPDNWSRVFEGDFSGKKPMVRMTPPTGAAWAEIHIGFTDWPSDDVGRGGTTFVDDIIIDEFQSSSTEVAKISDLRQIPDGQSVIIRSRQITALPGCGIPENTAYIEELDRSSGIRIDLSELNNWSAQTGDTVTITGFLATSQDGERFILATDMQQAAATDRIKPVIMTNKAAGGSTIGLQSGVWDGWFVENPDGTREYKSQEAAGLNPIGLLVKISGKVSQIDPNGAYFYIDDGARVDDGTYTGGDWNYGIRIALDGRNYTKGKFLTITGVVSCFRHTDGKLRRLIRPVLVEQEQ
ncbi:MAG TPA: carboxypeptidase regulatory-like domain-containing protein, partial [Armatimonadota bacterium]|nr:carboxypeptidase regulatory-like domain-containing protein [Armatimonadota bacterium]